MDLRIFYQKVREIECTIPTPFTVVVSEATPDGGKAGAMSEVSREAAARLVVEKRARLATAAEMVAFEQAYQSFSSPVAPVPVSTARPEPPSAGKRSRPEKE